MSAHELIAPKSAMTSQIACGSAAIVPSRRRRFSSANLCGLPGSERL